MTPKDRFCPDCGRGVTAAPQATGFQWKWAALSIPIVVGTTFACLVVAGIVSAMTGVDTEAFQDVVAVAAFIVGMFTGGLLAGFLSSTRTVFEPGVGIAAALIGVNVLSGDFSGVLMGWVIPFGLGSLGAALGEWLQRLKKSDS